LQEQHPEWFLRQTDKTFLSPGAWGVTWEDLVELKHQNVALWDELAEILVPDDLALRRAGRRVDATGEHRELGVGVEGRVQERVEALDTLLWTYREDSFLPHGTRRDGNSTAQPIYLTSNEDNPNGAGVRFLVDGAETTELSSYDRVVYLFDGRDADAVVKARGHWKAAKDAGCEVTYWQQSSEGRWQKKA
jgi:DNA polymerase-3 subunit chi